MTVHNLKFAATCTSFLKILQYLCGWVAIFILHCKMQLLILPVLPKFYWQNKQSNWGLSLSFKLWPDRDSSLELCIVANSNYLIKSAKLLAKSQFTHGKEASSSILCLYKLLRQWYERINRKYKLQQLDIHKVRQYMLEKTVHARKEEYWTEKLFLATS